MFRIKICGVTRPIDIDYVAESGGDCIGINVVPHSPRCVNPQTAALLTQHAHQLGLKVALVTMNLSASELQGWVEQLPLDALQLHGHETPAVLRDLPSSLFLIKALSWTGRAEEIDLASEWLHASQTRANMCWLVDAYSPGVGGGSGKVARWDMLYPRPEVLSTLPMMLAGGLKAENVAEAIRTTHCAGVDTASGVESAPGIKDPQLVRAFIHAAHEAILCRE